MRPALRYIGIGVVITLLGSAVLVFRRPLLARLSPPTVAIIWRQGVDLTGQPYSLPAVKLTDPSEVQALYVTVMNLKPDSGGCMAAQATVQYDVKFLGGWGRPEIFEAAPDGCELVSRIIDSHLAGNFYSTSKLWRFISRLLHVPRIHDVPRRISD